MKDSKDMSYFFVLRTNQAKNNQKIIAELDPNLGIITDRDENHHYYSRKQFWRNEGEYMIKSPDCKTAFSLMKYLKEKMTYCSIRRPVRVSNFRKIAPYVRPICFAQTERKDDEMAVLMTRNYYFHPSDKKDTFIDECRQGKKHILIENAKDFVLIINGDLDLLNLARELENDVIF